MKNCGFKSDNEAKVLAVKGDKDYGIKKVKK